MSALDGRPKIAKPLLVVRAILAHPGDHRTAFWALDQPPLGLYGHGSLAVRA
jgi:hypothetical protein